MRDVVGLAAEHGLSIRNAMGTITVFDDGEGEHSFLPDEDVAITGVAAGSQSIVFWSGQVDSLLFCRREPDLAGDGIRLVWYLDSVWTYRPGR